LTIEHTPSTVREANEICFQNSAESTPSVEAIDRDNSQKATDPNTSGEGGSADVNREAGHKRGSPIACSRVLCLNIQCNFRNCPGITIRRRPYAPESGSKDSTALPIDLSLGPARSRSSKIKAMLGSACQMPACLESRPSCLKEAELRHRSYYTQLTTAGY
jgi:hypothetical protein